ncbi:MAG: hypothetical protein ACJ8GN_07210 [Longimicrobiaceae bacterium]
MLNLHLKVLNHTYQYFRASGDWPLARKLELDFADEGEIDQIADEIGPDYIICQEMHSLDAICFLRLAGIELCDGAEDDVQNFLRVIPIFANAYSEDPTAQVTNQHLAEQLQLDKLATKRLCRILWNEGILYSSASFSNDGSTASFSPNRASFKLRKVKSLTEYLEQRENVHTPRKLHFGWSPATELAVSSDEKRTRENGAYIPEINTDLVQDTQLRELLTRDLVELQKCFDQEAWKAVGLLAGSCSEAILLDLLSRNPSAIPPKYQAQWQKQSSLTDLTRYAVNAGLLAPLEETLVGHLKEWRDQIHPWRSLQTPRPSRATARALLTLLELLSEKL